MKFLKYCVVVIVFFYQSSGVSQEVLNSDDAINQYKAISEEMELSFSESDIRTFSRLSFSQTDLETYLSQQFQRMDLLLIIDGHHKLKLDAYLHLGNWFQALGFPKESIKSYQNFFDYYKLHEKNLTAAERNDYLVMRFLAHSFLAENYAKLGQFKDATIEHHTNMAFTKSMEDVFYPSAINNYGIFLYWHKKELDSALYYFKDAYELTKLQFPNHTLIGSIRDNIADIYIEQNNFQQAQLLYDANFEFYSHTVNEVTFKKDIPRLISAGAQLIVTDLKLKRIKNAEIAFGKLERIVEAENQTKSISAESQLEFLKAKEQLLYNQNNQDAAYATAKLVEHYSDSLNQISKKADEEWQNQFNDITLDRIALNFKIDQLQKETKIKNQRAKLWITGSISSVFIIFLLLLFLGRHQHIINSRNKQLLAEQNLENSVLKVAQLNSEIKSKERDLSDFAINLIHNQDWASSLAEKMENYKLAEPLEKKHLLSDLEQTIKNKITFDQDTKVFFERLDKLSDIFYSQLMTHYPNLSKNEIQLCSLIRLKMDSRSISTLQNITLASLNTSRYRLRKKLNLLDDVNLDDFIQRL